MEKNNVSISIYLFYGNMTYFNNVDIADPYHKKISSLTCFRLEKVDMKNSFESKVKSLESKMTRLEEKVKHQEHRLRNLTEQLAAAVKKIPVISLSASLVSSDDNNNRQTKMIYLTCHEARAADPSLKSNQSTGSIQTERGSVMNRFESTAT